METQTDGWVLASWNVNGIRAAEKKGFIDWVVASGYDVVCLQETKADPDQLSKELLEIPGYDAYWSSAKRRGYSGVVTYTKHKPISVSLLDIPRFDDEGRGQLLEFTDFVLLNAYFPNSQDAGARLDYKLDFCESVQKLCNSLVADGRNTVICGDYNVAHKEIDLENPKSNEKNPGFLPEERAWMDRFTGGGFVDTFRIFDQSPKNYTWWSYMFRAREKNVGWRIDYHCVNEEFRTRVAGSEILSSVYGSDHCPVLLRLT